MENTLRVDDTNFSEETIALLQQHVFVKRYNGIAPTHKSTTEGLIHRISQAGRKPKITLSSPPKEIIHYKDLMPEVKQPINRDKGGYSNKQWNDL